MGLITRMRGVLAPLRSRKLRVALATVLSAYGAEYGLNLSEDVIHTVLGVGVALILGIAHEDAAGVKIRALGRLPE
jgi:hypothetical protein